LDILQKVAQQTGLPYKSVVNVIKLTEEGATIPFLARYRKEVTGQLDEVDIAKIVDSKKDLDTLEERKQTIIAAITESGLLTDDLKQAILKCEDKVVLEDLYLPYKKRKKTRGDIAKDKGLEGLAKLIMAQRSNPLDDAKRFLNADVQTVADAIAGAKDIMAEWVNENPNNREYLRNQYTRFGKITSKVVGTKKEAATDYQDYFEFSEQLIKCPSHRFLAMLRGKEEGFLRVKVDADEELLIHKIQERSVKSSGPAADIIKEAVKDGLQRLLLPSVENAVLSSYKEKADKEAISVFCSNLKQLLLTAPLGSKSVLALDPGFRTGCKLVCLSATADLLHHETIYPNPPQNESVQAGKQLKYLIEKFGIEAIAIGNGTASRETKAFVDQVIEQLNTHVDVFVVSESGASIYSASKTGRDEFPDLDATVRGSISIGRRLIDPLAELVKIDAKSIGVGQYQHDVDQGKLKEGLDQTVIHAVNLVGVDLNTASSHLLQYISGLGPTLAQNIVDYRSKLGAFSKREELLKVPRLGPKAYEQSVGFLRIRSGKSPLDNTGVHPESYELVQQIAKDLGLKTDEIIGKKEVIAKVPLEKYVNDKFGMPTLKDIVKELQMPGHDPRGSAQSFSFSKTVKSSEDLYVGLELPGIVNNITKFGAFVDIGIKENGLLHISEISNTFISDPAEVLKLGQSLTVKIIALDLPRNRINLSLKQVGKPS